MTTRVTSLRLDPETLKRLKRLAHRESLDRDREVTWSSLVRRAIERLLAGQDRSRR